MLDYVVQVRSIVYNVVLVRFVEDKVMQARSVVARRTVAREMLSLLS